MCIKQVLSSGCNSIKSIKIFHRIQDLDTEWAFKYVENPATQEAVVWLQAQESIEARIVFTNNANLSYDTGVHVIEGQ